MIRAVFNSVSGQLIVNDTNFVLWNERQNRISRSKKYHGVIITESLELTFMGAAYDYLLNLDNTYDIAADCDITIQLYNISTGWVDDFVGKIDFTTKKQDDNSGRQITFSAYSNEFSKKILERDNIEIPYDRLTTLDDGTITPFADEYGTIQIQGTEITNRSIFNIQESLSVNLSPVFPSISTNNQNGLQSTVVKDSSGSGFNFSAPNDEWIEDRAFFLANGLSGNVSVTFTLSWKTTPGGDQFSRIKMQDYKGSLTPTDIYDSGNNPYSDPTTGLATLEITLDYDFATNSRLTLNVTSGANVVDFYLTESTITLKSILTPTNCEFVPPNQAFERVIESITNTPSAFLSDYFTTGDGFYILLTNGKLIRQYPVGYLQSDENQVSQLSFKLTDLFENYDKILNIGAGVEYSGGQYNLRVEQKEYFYDSTVILTIDRDEIEIDSFSKERDLTYYYGKINTGYNFEKVEDEGAMEDFNTKSEFSSPVVLDTELDLTSSYIASGYAIESARRNPFNEKETTDYKYDNDTFFFSTYRVGVNLVQRTTQGFAEVNGIDDIETPINLVITPTRNLLKHSWLINTGFRGYQDKTLKYNKSEITTNLETRLDSESQVVRENQDINITDLNTSLFSGNIVRFSAPVGSSTFSLLKENPYKLIKYWDTLIDDYSYGFLKEVSTSPIDKETNWEIIEVNNFVEGESYRLLQDGSYRLLEDGNIRLLED